LPDGNVDVGHFNNLPHDVLNCCHDYCNLLVYSLFYFIFKHIPAIPVAFIP
jgi:hypothetical protein